MNYMEWETRLVEALKGLPTAETIKVTSYYREMYGDKLDAGLKEEDILTEFGDPKACAEKIIAENASEDTNHAGNGTSDEKSAKDLDGQSAPLSKKQTAKGIILALLFTLFAGLPLAACLVAIVISLGAVCISGGAGILAGFVYLFIAPFIGMGAGIAMHIGMGIGAIGVCGLLGLGGFFATKYCAIYFYKLLKMIYRGIIK